MSYRSEPNENLFVAAQYLRVLESSWAKPNLIGESFFKRERNMADSVKSEIKEAGSALGSAAKIAGENANAVAVKIAEKAAEATKSVGTAVKKTGESIQKKSGK